MNQSGVVKDYDFNEPDFLETGYLLDEKIKDCRNKSFQTFEYRFVYDNKFTKASNNERVNFTNTNRSMEFKTEFFVSIKKTKMLQEMIFYLIREKTNNQKTVEIFQL